MTNETDPVDLTPPEIPDQDDDNVLTDEELDVVGADAEDAEPTDEGGSE